MLWSCMCSLIEMLWVLKEKISLNLLKSSMMCLLLKFLNLTYMWTFFIFYETELGIFTTCEKLRAFERNQNLENSCLMS